MRFDAVDANRKAAHPVARRIDEIGEAHVRTVAALLDLLAQEGERHMALLVGEVDRDAVTVARAGPESADAARGQPFLRDQSVEHRIGIGLERLRRLADHLVVHDRRPCAVQLPRAEERRPVDAFAEVLERPVVEAVQPGLQRRRGLVAEIGVVKVGARLFEGVEHALSLARAHVADMGIIVLIALHIGVAPGVADERGCDADRTARVEDVEHRPLVRGVDAERGVDLRRRRAADQQRHRHAARAAFPRQRSPSRRATG